MEFLVLQYVERERLRSLAEVLEVGIVAVLADVLCALKYAVEQMDVREIVTQSVNLPFSLPSAMSKASICGCHWSDVAVR